MRTATSTTNYFRRKAETTYGTCDAVDYILVVEARTNTRAHKWISEHMKWWKQDLNAAELNREHCVGASHWWPFRPLWEVLSIICNESRLKKTQTLLKTLAYFCSSTGPFRDDWHLLFSTRQCLLLLQKIAIL